MEREVKQAFFTIAGVITALFLPTLVFLPTLEQKAIAFVAIIVGACGIAALVVKLRKKS